MIGGQGGWAVPLVVSLVYFHTGLLWDGNGLITHDESRASTDMVCLSAL